MAHPPDIDVKVHVSVVRHQRLGARPIITVPDYLDHDDPNDQAWAESLAEMFAASTGSPMPVILSGGVTVSEWAGPGRYAETPVPGRRIDPQAGVVAVEGADGYEAARRAARAEEDHFHDEVIPRRVEAVLEEMNENVGPDPRWRPVRVRST